MRPSKFVHGFVRFLGALLFLIGLCGSFLLPLVCARKGLIPLDTHEAVMGLFSVFATAIGAMLLVIELTRTRRATCCSMLSDLNMKFIENEKLMRLYQELCHCVQHSDSELKIDNKDPEAVHSEDLMAYMTFYEVINEYIKNGVLSIEQMDDLFGDRFFKLIHNDYVQEHELYAEPSSYVNIFQLYGDWKTYRERSSKRFVVSGNHEIPDIYFKEKMYLHETYQFYMNGEVVLSNKKGEQKTLKMQRLLPKHLKMVETFQRERILVNIPDKKIFALSTTDEFLESMLIDFCYGLFDGDRLVAVCLCVLNRKTKVTGDHERNLCVLTSEPKEYRKYVTFDTIQVDPDYRGYGIQNFFLGKAEEVAEKVNASYMIATVSPDNPYSKNMFDKNGYHSYTEKPLAMYGAERWLMVKGLKNENLSQ